MHQQCCGLMSPSYALLKVAPISQACCRLIWKKRCNTPDEARRMEQRHEPCFEIFLVSRAAVCRSICGRIVESEEEVHEQGESEPAFWEATRTLSKECFCTLSANDAWVRDWTNLYNGTERRGDDLALLLLLHSAYKSRSLHKLRVDTAKHVIGLPFRHQGQGRWTVYQRSVGWGGNSWGSLWKELKKQRVHLSGGSFYSHPHTSQPHYGHRHGSAVFYDTYLSVMRNHHLHMLSQRSSFCYNPFCLKFIFSCLGSHATQSECTMAFSQTSNTDT